jgi:L-amino acid N-acyltransferase YncA
MIRRVKESDAPQICGIYNEYVLKTWISFEETPVTVEDMQARIAKITQGYPWLVDEEDGNILGSMYASPWKERSAYRYAAEASYYTRSDQIGKGIGTRLMTELLKELRLMSLHSVICGIALPNPASIALCQKFGFEPVAHFREVGFKMGQWIDVDYWELVLDARK